MKSQFLAMLAIDCVWLVTHTQAAPEIAAVTEPACNGEVVVLTGFDPRDPAAAVARAHALCDAGASRLVAGTRYDDVDGFRRQLDFMTQLAL